MLSMFSKMVECFNFYVMRYNCVFSYCSDLQETIPGLAPNMELAITEGVVLDTSLNPEYNSIDDPLRITGRIRDVFDAVEYQRSVAKSLKSSASAAAASSSTEQASAGEKA